MKSPQSAKSSGERDDLPSDTKNSSSLTRVSLAQKIKVQGSAKEWSLGCVKRAPAARGQDAEITQPRAYSLAEPCTTTATSVLTFQFGSLDKMPGRHSHSASLVLATKVLPY